MSFLLQDGVPMYTLSHKGEAVVLPSRLGFELRGTIKAEDVNITPSGITKTDRKPSYMFDRNFELIGSGTDTFDETWEPVWGEESKIRNHYNELLVQLRQKDSGRLVNLRFRLYDDGLGFRYEFPAGQELNYFTIKEELTEFALASDCTAWWIPGDYDTQEYEYEVCKLSEIEKNFANNLRDNSSQTPFSTSGVQTSLQMKSEDGLYINIHEAELRHSRSLHGRCGGYPESRRGWGPDD